MSTEPNWQLPGEPVTRRIASSSTGSQLWVGCRVDDVGGSRPHTGVVAAIPDPPAEYVTVEWADGSRSMHLPGRLLRVGDTRANEEHAERWLAERTPPPPTPPLVPDPPSVKHDAHYVQVAFDEPTVQLLTAILGAHIGTQSGHDELVGLSDAQHADLQLARRARAQLLYGYARWLEGA